MKKKLPALLAALIIAAVASAQLDFEYAAYRNKANRVAGNLLNNRTFKNNPELNSLQNDAKTSFIADTDPVNSSAKSNLNQGTKLSKVDAKNLKDYVLYDYYTISKPCGECNGLVSAATLNKTIEKDFSQLITGNEKSELLNSYAGIDLANSTLNLNLYVPFRAKQKKLLEQQDPRCKQLRELVEVKKKKDALRIMVGGLNLFFVGGLADNIAAVVQNDVFNTDISGGLNFALPVLDLLRINGRANCDARKEMEKELFSLLEKHEIQVSDSVNELSLLKRQIEDKEQLLKAAVTKKDTPEIYKIRKDLNELKLKYIAVPKRKVVEDTRAEILKQETGATFPVKWYGWLTFGGKGGYAKFNLYDPTLAFDNLTTKTNAITGGGFVKLNTTFSHTDKPLRNFYLGMGYETIYTHNLTDLTKKDITTATKFESGNTTKVVEKKGTVYQESADVKFKQRLYSNLSIDAIWKFIKTEALSVGVRTNVAFSKKEQLSSLEKELIKNNKLDLWTYGWGLGLITSIQNKKKDEPAVNLEFYVNFNDLANEKKTVDSKFHQRNDIGIRIGVPFSLIKS